MSDSLRPHESQHARPPCPSPTPRVYSNSCPSSQWYHPAISSSVILFSSCPQANRLVSHIFTEAGRRCMRTQGRRQKLPFHRASLASPVQLGDIELSSLIMSNFEFRKPQSFKENQKCSTLFQMVISQRAKKHILCLEETCRINENLSFKSANKQRKKLT